MDTKTNEVLKQRMNDLLRDARALKALIEEAKAHDSARSARRYPVERGAERPDCTDKDE